MCTHTFAQRQSHSSAVTPSVLFCLLSSLKSLTCILLSFILLPRLPIFPPLSLSPCGFCHLFTDEWPLHRYDLNVSQPSLYDSLPLSLHLFVSVWTSIKFFPTSCPYYLHPLLKAQHFLTSFANTDLSIIGLPLLCLSASPLKVTGTVNSQYSTSDLTVSLYLSLKVLMQLLNPSRCIAWIVSSFFVSSYPDLTCLPSSPSGLYIKHSRVSG